MGPNFNSCRYPEPAFRTMSCLIGGDQLRAGNKIRTFSVTTRIANIDRRWLMKNLIVFAAMAALQCGALAAQTLTGTWQGTLKVPQAPNGELRVVVKISISDADKLKADFYSIDQRTPGIPATAVSQSGSTFKMTIAALNGNFEGKVSADAKAIAGTWTQGAPLPLTLVKATPETAWTIPEPPPPPQMMNTNAKPEFEVATIKPSRPEERFSLLLNRSGMLNTTGTSLADLLKFAYDLHPRQIAGGPSWLESEKFDVSGKPDTAGMPSVNQLKMMLQKLLADRFALTFHLEKKDLSIYAITVAKGGLKIAKEETNPIPVPGFGGPPLRGFNVRNATIAEFANVMQAQFMDQPVVDQTGLGTQRYNFVLKWTPDASQRSFGGGGPEPNAPAAAPDADAPPDLFTAFQQQLGLRMQTTKGPVDVLVIDKVEKPSAN
jgi:uncharacterized protein (TIGR03435 family)